MTNMVVDMEVDKVADELVDMVVDKEVDKYADLEMDMECSTSMVQLTPFYLHQRPSQEAGTPTRSPPKLLLHIPFKSARKKSNC